jgi:hypothetical protein
MEIESAKTQYLLLKKKEDEIASLKRHEITSFFNNALKNFHINAKNGSIVIKIRDMGGGLSRQEIKLFENEGWIINYIEWNYSYDVSIDHNFLREL